MKKKINIISIIISLLLLVLTAAFAIVVLRARLLPTAWTVLLLAALVLIDALLIFLCAKPGKKLRFAIGIILTLLFVLGICYGSATLNKTVNTLKSITNTSPQYSRVCVYVPTEDSAQSIEDVAGDCFGFLSTADRENTDQAIAQINEELNVSVQAREYEGLTALLNALFDGEVRSMILNPEYLALVEEVDGFADVGSRVRVLTELRIRQPEQQNTTPTTSEEPEAEDHCFSVYISGIDTYGEVSMKSRSDVNIIINVNTETHQILMVTTPRDYYVPLPISDGQRDKLTHAGIYGIDVSKGALEMLYETEIDYYFRLNFTGFVKIIDAIGGIDAELDGFDGVRHLNGEEALQRARDRSGSGGDNWRGKNQLRIIQAAINKVLSPAILSSFNDVLKATEGSFETDVPYELIAELVRNQLATNPQWEILRYNVTGTGDSEIPFTTMMLDGKPMYLYVMWPNEDDVAAGSEMMQAMHRDEVISLP
ncbi:MAG: LCP family protein [Candidatus Limivicinus sp.]